MEAAFLNHGPMTSALEQVIEPYRDELQQYGEMLALFVRHEVSFVPASTGRIGCQERIPRHFGALCAPEPERGIYAASTLPGLRASKRHKCRAPKTRFV